MPNVGVMVGPRLREEVVIRLCPLLPSSDSSHESMVGIRSDVSDGVLIQLSVNPI